MSSLGTDTATTIVETDTATLIVQADNIVKGCTGTNCNTSDTIRTSITQNSSILAQNQATATLVLLSIPTSSVLGRQIYEAYLNLGAAVASVYNFQCGDNTTTSSTCVPNASSVKDAQNSLQSLLVQPATNQANHIIVLSILLAIGIIAFILFFIFLIIGLFEKLFEAPVEGAKYAARLEAIQEQPEMEKIPIPASPFDTTEPVYK